MTQTAEATETAPVTTTQNPVSIRGALNGLRTILAEQIAEGERAILRAQRGLNFVAQIEQVLGYEPTSAPTPASVAAHLNGNGHSNGNGHAPADEKVSSRTRSAKAQKAIDALTPQQQKLVKLLERKGESYTPKEVIAEKLELTDPNQVGALVSNTRAGGVDIENAAVNRKEGQDVPEGMQGYRLGSDFRLS